MKRILLTVCALAALWLVPTLASATHIDNFVATADCEGWSIDFRVVYLNGDSTADMTYTVLLLDSGMAEVARVEYAATLANSATSWYKLYHYEGVWGEELCGDFTATVDVTLMPDYGSDFGEFSAQAAFTCDCGEEEHSCTYTPGYWKNHLENWPLQTVLVGADELSQSEAMTVLNTPVRGDATIILGYHLIAATLNVANGADPAIQAAIDEANDLLTQYPLGSRPSGDAKTAIIYVKDQLAVYNERHCGDGAPDGDLEKSASAVDETTWDTLKAFYR